MSGEELNHCASPVDSSTPATLGPPGCHCVTFSVAQRARCVAGFGGGMEQVRLWQSGNGLLKRLVSVPRAQCLPLAGPAAGAGGRKGTGVAEPREETGFS